METTTELDDLSHFIGAQFEWLHNKPLRFSNVFGTNSKKAKAKKLVALFDSINGQILNQQKSPNDIFLKFILFSEIGFKALVLTKLNQQDSGHLIVSIRDKLKHVLEYLNESKFGSIKTFSMSMDLKKLELFLFISMGKSFAEHFLFDQDDVEIFQQKCNINSTKTIHSIAFLQMFISLFNGNMKKLNDYFESQKGLCKRSRALKLLLTQAKDNVFGIALICQEILKFKCENDAKCVCLELDQKLEITKNSGFKIYRQLNKMMLPKNLTDTLETEQENTKNEDNSTFSISSQSIKNYLFCKIDELVQNFIGNCKSNNELCISPIFDTKSLLPKKTENDALESIGTQQDQLFYLYIIDLVSLNKRAGNMNDAHNSFGFICANKLPSSICFPMCLKHKGDELSISRATTQKLINQNTLEFIRKFHVYVFENILKVEQKKCVVYMSEKDKMPLLVVPLIKKIDSKGQVFDAKFDYSLLSELFFQPSILNINKQKTDRITLFALPEVFCYLNQFLRIDQLRILIVKKGFGEEIKEFLLGYNLAKFNELEKIEDEKLDFYRQFQMLLEKERNIKIEALRQKKEQERLEKEKERLEALKQKKEQEKRIKMEALRQKKDEEKRIKMEALKQKKEQEKLEKLNVYHQFQMLLKKEKSIEMGILKCENLNTFEHGNLNTFGQKKEKLRWLKKTKNRIILWLNRFLCIFKSSSSKKTPTKKAPSSSLKEKHQTNDNSMNEIEPGRDTVNLPTDDISVTQEKSNNFGDKQDAFQVSSNLSQDEEKTNKEEIDVHQALLFQILAISNDISHFNIIRLKLIGRSFLKLVVLSDLFLKFPSCGPGKLDEYLVKATSSSNLKQIGKIKILPSIMNFQKINKNITIRKNHNILDIVRILIGVHLISFGSISTVKFINWLGINAMFKMENSNVSPLQFIELKGDTTSSRNSFVQNIYTKHGFKSLEHQIGYTFKNKSFLVQAFIHQSYEKGRILIGDYRRLEFLGDSILDYLVKRFIFEHGDYDDRMFLYQDVLLTNANFALLSVKNELHEFLIFSCIKLAQEIKNFVVTIDEEQKKESQNEGQNEGQNKDQNEEHNRNFIVSKRPNHRDFPKELADIFESLAAAIFFDSQMNLDTVWSVFRNLMKY